MSTINVSAEFNLTTTETADATEVPAGAAPQISHSTFNRPFSRSAASTPPNTHALYQTLTGAAGTIDLTALATAFGVKSATGKKLRTIRIYNPNVAGNFVIAVGAANGYAIGGTPITVFPGGTVMIDFNDGLLAVDGTHKTLDWTGTALLTYQASLILG